MECNREQGYGLTRELAEKVAEKYSSNSEVEIVALISKLTGAEPPLENGPNAFRQWLQVNKIYFKKLFGQKIVKIKIKQFWFRMVLFCVH